MKIKSSILRIVLGLSITTGVKAAIVFGNAANMSSDSDVITTGTLVQATNWGTTQTVNGVEFTATSATTGGVGSPVTYGQFAFTGATNVHTTAFTVETAPFTSLSPGYRASNIGAIFRATAGTFTVNMTGLVDGQEYAVQVWSVDPRAGGTTGRTASIADGSSSKTIDYNVGNTGGGVGQYVVGTFIASGTSESFVMASTSVAQINSMQLRAIPEPASSALIALGGLVLILRRHK